MALCLPLFIKGGEAMEKVLIFGAGGFVSSYLSKEFLEHGYVVIGSDKARGTILPDEVALYTADLMDAAAVENLIYSEKPDIIVNLAAISSVGTSWCIPQTTMMVNVVGALNILEAVRKCSKKTKIMFIGSSEEYVTANYSMNEETELDANNPYGISKVTQERFAKLYREQYGIQVYCVRAFNHTGVGQRDSFVLPNWCKQVADIEKLGNPGAIKVGNLSVQRDFSHVKDIVRAYRMIIESDNCERIYNVGSGKAYRLDEMLNFIIGLSTQNITVEVDESRIRPTDQVIICCDHALITKELCWEPEYTVFDALKELFEDFVK